MADNGTQFIEQVYEQMQQLKLVKTQDEFSKKIVGKSPRWYSATKARQRNISVSSLFNMATNIERIALDQRSRNIKKNIMEVHNLVLEKLADKTPYYE
jgi:hypothetical protein